MNEIISKISSYSLLNELVPGVVFSILVEAFTPYSLIQENILIGLFLYYFVGLIISRVGSLFIEPLLRWTTFVKFSNYSEFVKACRGDKKIETLSEQNNMYRAFIAMFILLFLLKMYEVLTSMYVSLKLWNEPILLILLFVLFLVSYRKQTNYISKRVDIDKK
ncbi:MAG: hypothetical protein HOJ15_02670 [Candidatus Jacksonbacteria bacterium]|jgi:hypothetical protein|nr:hypothetical protein [Candidatus Jacksonbacteria bacterium]MBT6034513.1 hypothetical protein [Candidatus Jacksonbacteria bacterium]MBT6301304.1 hypothetical protein [Candidatus Jacksonbacteria bacterium]MBT6756846.1 hypothetical protein [Candidatus Jacksonbacteria bacterium]MBT6955020.1 hypothetical protein [Candidatus Jacksonbacteria bacterium]